MKTLMKAHAVLVNIIQYASVIADNPVLMLPLVLWALKH